MAYYLCVRKGKGYDKLNINSLSEFERLSNFKEDRYSLEEIDKCTSQYSDEIYFREKLYYHGILSREDIDNELSIRYLKDGKLNKVKYGLVYEEESAYFNDNNLLYLLKILFNDNHFFEKLNNNFSNYREVSETLAVIRNLILGSYNLNNIRRLSDFLYEYRQITGVSKVIYDLDHNIFNYDSVMSSLISVFFYNFTCKREFVRGEFNYYNKRYDNYYKFSKLNYRNFHDLAMFVYVYLNGDKHLTEDDKKDLKEFTEDIDEVCNEQVNKPKVKKRVKEREEIEGQLSLFD